MLRCRFQFVFLMTLPGGMRGVGVGVRAPAGQGRSFVPSLFVRSVPDCLLTVDVYCLLIVAV